MCVSVCVGMWRVCECVCGVSVCVWGVGSERISVYCECLWDITCVLGQYGACFGLLVAFNVAGEMASQK